MKIRTRPKPACPSCGRQGAMLHRDLADELFQAPGRWNVRRCADPSCGLLWLDPCPEEEDLLALYANYYTHAPQEPAPQRAAPRPGAAASVLRCLYARICSLLGVTREKRRMLSYFLRRGRGTVLEAGCGDGERLLRLRRLGWRAEGQEVDPVSAEIARRRSGATVHEGDLERLRLPARSFDAVVMNHVIEHAHDPLGMLAECRRLLKRGGRLVLFTPNADSLGLRLFGPAWRGLEPPRHLHVFTRGSLAAAARRAGFEKVRCRTSAANADAMISLSYALRGRLGLGRGPCRRVPDPFRSSCLHVLERVGLFFFGRIGEECILTAERGASGEGAPHPAGPGDSGPARDHPKP